MTIHELVDDAPGPVEDALSDDEVDVTRRVRHEPSALDQFLRSVSLPRTSTISLLAAIVASVFVFLQLRPELIFSDTTPSGGDMGAHVWGPAYLRDNLLTQGRFTGWTPDWYAGFPAYHYYMVVPALAIIAVNAGFTPLLGLPLAVGGFLAARRLVAERQNHRILIWSLAALFAVLVVGLPYGMAFKVVSVSGLVMFPLAGWFMARLARCPEPVPGFVALGSLIFLFDTNFTIYGGNIASTLAGEFAFSLSLCLTLVAIGVAMRGLDDDAWRVRAAIVIALVALCHIIPLFFLVAALMVLVLLHDTIPRPWLLGAGITMALIPVGTREGAGFASAAAAIVSFAVVVGAIVLADPAARRRASWLLVVGPVSAMLTGFWLLPFYLRSDYFNDMGWERLDEVGPALLTTPMKVLLPIAIVGGVLAFAIRDRMGMLFSIMATLSASGVANLPESKLWNARLLPFYYLSVYLLAAVGIALIVRFSAAALSERLDAPDRRALSAAPVVGLAVAVIAVGVPLRILPFSGIDDTGRHTWFGIRSNEASFLPSWVAWNYSGYEEKRSYREYRDVVAVMGELGTANGCGRAMWEYDKGLDRYGTPMALMLLPHWTDGCIGSMEGLYFESSATTPFHFLHQSTLSAAPSRAQRDLPYGAFNLDVGVAQLQTMGVRYYMALSDEAIEAADAHPALTMVAESQPWVVYEVADSELVEGLSTEPVVTEGPAPDAVGELGSRFDVGWVSQAVAFYNNPNGFLALPAEDGPEDWERVSTLLPNDGEALVAAGVSNIETTNDTITFDVDQVGRPVLVKTSYFPNWDASGAEGPWRVGPNLMAVVPTDTTVKLSYGYTWAEYFGYLVTFLGLAGLVTLYRRNQRSELVAVAAAAPEADVEHPPAPESDSSRDASAERDPAAPRDASAERDPTTQL